MKQRMARVSGESRIEEAERPEALVAFLDERRTELSGFPCNPSTVRAMR